MLWSLRNRKPRLSTALIDYPTTFSSKTTIFSCQKLNTLSHGQYSQVHKMRTLCSVFRSATLEILKNLSIGCKTGNAHFVRCVRPELEYIPRGFQVSSTRLKVDWIWLEICLYSSLIWFINNCGHWPSWTRPTPDSEATRNVFRSQNFCADTSSWRLSSMKMSKSAKIIADCCWSV